MVFMAVVVAAFPPLGRPPSGLPVALALGSAAVLAPPPLLVVVVVVR